MLKSGITTVVQFGSLIAERIVHIAGELGVRAYVVPAFKSGQWYTPDGRRVEYEWAADQGLPDLERAVEFVKTHTGAPDGRVRSFLGPAQIDTCTPELLRRTAERAATLDVPVTIHASQATIEFQEITRRYGRTPLEQLHEVGLLDRRLIISHCIFISGHPLVAFPGGRDLELLAASGAHVAHCPWVFGRRGILMQSYARYRRAGINVALGTDTFPQDMVHEMRQAAIFGKVAETDPRVATAADVSHRRPWAGRAPSDVMIWGASRWVPRLIWSSSISRPCRWRPSVIPSRTSSAVPAATTSTRSWWMVVWLYGAAS
jgi:cytosine/adenosine deaminase-related metal-dependent hydrolase